MRQIKIILVLFSLINCIAARDFRDPENRNNIEHFRITAIPVEIISNDSINLLTYFDIPNSTLQFVKNDSGFIAEFEAIISIRNKRKMQVARQIWTGAIFVEDYRATVSDKLYTTMFAKVNVPVLDLKLVGELFDKDTRETASKEIPISLEEYKQDTFLFPLVLMKKQPGNWGLGEDLKPVLNNKVYLENDNYRLHISGRIRPGPYSINASNLDNNDSIRWNETFDNITESKHFKLVIEIPKGLLTGFNTNIKINLVQNDLELHKNIQLTINNPGIPASITDIDEAIDQLRYISSDNEHKTFKKAKKNERKKLLREFWIKRDPTPNTEKNELMAEYYNRIKYSNEHFSTFLPGWRSDMGMIYIIFGKPDDIERIYGSSSRYSGQKWYYYNVNRSFVFIDESGFGDFRLLTPYYGRSSW